MGVKGASIFYKLTSPFNIIRGFAIDWMHCIPLGVTKYFLSQLLSEQSKSKPFFIGNLLDKLTKRLSKIKPPHIIGRFPRSLDDLQNWKATEFKNWLLHYSLPVMYKILPPLYMLHWSLLVAAVGILCSENISKSGLVTANQMLKDFVILAENLYGVKRCTMNVHQLTHLSFYVLKRGPLWACSCFAFEGFNAVIKSLVHGTHHAAEQIGCALGLSLGLARLVEKIFCDFIFLPPKVKKLLCKFSGTKLKKSNTKTSLDHGAFLGKPKLPTSVDENIFEVIRNITTQKGWAMCPTANSTNFYSRFVSDKGHLFYSLIHKESKKFNSTVI